MSRSQDTVIDDDEETCPLCIEEFDLTDKNFRPCPCGYQICQFCFNSLKTTYEKSTCPNCRRVYDDKTIQYKIPTAEEFKLDQQAKNRKQQAAKRKETEKREVETSSRRNLAGVRVKQQNLVYVIGLIPDINDEPKLLQTLRGQHYFGQYGEIEKIVVSKAKPGAASQGVGVYVTYARKEDAATCINTVDGSMNGERVLRAQYGTTKYCSAYLRGEICNNKSCSFLHETGEDGQHTTLQNEPMNPKPIAKPAGFNPNAYAPPTGRPPATQAAAASQPMARQISKDQAESRKGSNDTSALPSSASWAHANPTVAKSRRTSQTASRSSPSPQVINATPVSNSAIDVKGKEKEPLKISTSTVQQTTSRPSTQNSAGSAGPSKQASAAASIPSHPPPKEISPFDRLLASLSSPCGTPVFDDSSLSQEERAAIHQYPNLIDPFGGLRLRFRREREAAERARQENEICTKQEAHPQTGQNQTAGDGGADEEQIGAGSLALGGEPEDNPRSASARGAIQRPSQPTSATNYVSDQFSTMAAARNLTPQQLGLLGSASIQQAPGLEQPSQTNFGSEVFDLGRRSQYPGPTHYESHSGHQRHGSRYFHSENSSKFNAPARSQGQPSFYSSGVQGPPPGLKNAGTPPISGGGMFAHGQGFTSNVSTAFGSSKENNAEMSLRGRSGTNDVSKREYLRSLPSTLGSPPFHASALGLLSPSSSSSVGAYQDPGLLRQKKGKKHRHANTSSSGGGVGDHADPSILQARAIPNGTGTGTTGQTLFGGANQVDDISFPPLPARPEIKASNARIATAQETSKSSARSSTPKIPPGLDISHAHPSPALPPAVGDEDQKSTTRPATLIRTTTGPVAPAVPILPVGPWASTPKSSSTDAAINIKKGPAHSAEQPKIPAVPTPRSNSISLGSPKPRSSITKVEKDDGTLPSSAVDQQSSVKMGQAKESTSPPFATRAPHEPVITEKDLERTTTIVEADKQPLSTPGSKKPSLAVDVETTKQPANETTPVFAPEHVATSIALSSTPATPTTNLSDISQPSVQRTRTLRVITGMNQKIESAPPSAATEKSSSVPTATSQLKQRSRQPSISSLARSRPSTPAMSESVFSNDISRTNSPPPSVVGSAPERLKSKNQVKKGRKDKAKKPTDNKEDSSSVPTPPAVEPVGPIVSRQRKQKRAVPINTKGGRPIKSESAADQSASDTPVSATLPSKFPKSDAVVSETQSDVQPEVKPNSSSTKEKKLESKKASALPTPAAEEPPAVTTTTAPTAPSLISPAPPAAETSNKPPYTLRDFYTETSKLPPSPSSTKTTTSTHLQRLLNEHISPMPSILQSANIPPTSALLNPPPLTSYRLPPTPHRGTEYLNSNGYTPTHPFGAIYLTPPKKSAIQKGHAVRIADQSRPNDLIRRAMVSSSGTVWRHLSEAEEERVLDLEERREMYADDYESASLGRMDNLGKLEADDYANIEGGVEELVRNGARHGIHWVVEDDNDDEGDDEDGQEVDKGAGEFSDDAEDEDDEDEDDLGISFSLHHGAYGAPPPPAPASPSRPTPIDPEKFAGDIDRRVESWNRNGQVEAMDKEVNLRTMDMDALSKRIVEMEKVVASAKKEAERVEKLVVKKGREVGKWREGAFRT